MKNMIFLSGAGAIDPTDPAAAAASKMRNLVSFLIQVDLASTYIYVCLFFVICCAPRNPLPKCAVQDISFPETKALAEKQAKEAMAMAQAKCCLQ